MVNGERKGQYISESGVCGEFGQQFMNKTLLHMVSLCYPMDQRGGNLREVVLCQRRVLVTWSVSQWAAREP